MDAGSIRLGRVEHMVHTERVSDSIACMLEILKPRKRNRTRTGRLGGSCLGILVLTCLMQPIPKRNKRSARIFRERGVRLIFLSREVPGPSSVIEDLISRICVESGAMDGKTAWCCAKLGHRYFLDSLAFR